MNSHASKLMLNSYFHWLESKDWQLNYLLVNYELKIWIPKPFTGYWVPKAYRVMEKFIHYLIIHSKTIRMTFKSLNFRLWILLLPWKLIISWLFLFLCLFNFALIYMEKYERMHIYTQAKSVSYEIFFTEDLKQVFCRSNLFSMLDLLGE